MALSFFERCRDALQPASLPANEVDIELQLLDQPHNLGVGRDGAGRFVLIGPGQPQTEARTGPRFSYEPWTELFDPGSGLTLTDVCVLRFTGLPDEPQLLEAVAAVFAGLVELARTQPLELGPAILALQGLFEAGLISRVARETELGLAGELLVIREASDPSALVATWHGQPQGQFDFSKQGERLEVKCTSGSTRTHWFSSGQMQVPGACVTFASLTLPQVEVGTTVASLFEELATSGALSDSDVAKVRTVIIDTANEPPELLRNVVFDAEAARHSLMHLSVEDVPAPLPVPGVGAMRWEGTIPNDVTAVPAGCWFHEQLGR